jgi:PAS domain S-box-containing protein
MRVLVAEDDRLCRRFLTSTLHLQGHEVSAATSGPEAWEAFQEGGFPVVLLGWDLPGIDGLEVCRRIRASAAGRHAWILFVTGRDQESDVARALEAGADDYVSKPVSRKHLQLRMGVAQARVKERQEAIERAESLNDFLAGSDELIQTLGLDGRILHANHATMLTLGYAEPEVPGLSLPDLVREDRREAFLEVFRRAAKGHGLRRVQTVLVARNGHEVAVEGSLQPRLRGRTPTSVRAILHDVSRRNRAEDALRSVVAGTAAATGHDFFRSLTRHIAEALGVRHAFIGETTGPRRDRLRTLAAWANGAPAPAVERDLAGTPGALVARGEVCHVPRGVRERFPDDPLLAESGAESYLGLPMLDAAGECIGLLGVLHDRPIEEGNWSVSVLRTFAARAGAELERTRAEERLRRRERYMAALAEMKRHLLGWGGSWSDLERYLAPLGEASGVSRACVYENGTAPDGRAMLHRRVEWCAPGVPADPSSASYAWAEAAPHWHDVLAAGGTVSARTEDVPCPERSMLEGKGIRSVLVLPLVVEGAFAGLMAFGDGSTERAWESAEVDLLRSACAAVSLAMERRRALEDLRVQRERLDSILGNLDEIVWSVSARDRRRVYLNPVAERVYGRSLAEFYAEPDLTLRVVVPEDREKVEAFLARAAEQGSADAEYRIRRPDGSLRWILDHARLTRDADGQPARIDGIAQDITRRKSAERRSEAFTLLAMRLNGATTAEEAARTVGAVAADLLPWDAFRVVLADEGTGPLLCLARQAGGLVEVPSATLPEAPRDLARRVLAEGPVRLYLPTPGRGAGRTVLAAPIRSGSRPVGILSVECGGQEAYGIDEFTTLQALADHCGTALDRTRAQERLGASEARNQAILNSIPDLMFRLSDEGVYLDYHSNNDGLLVAPPSEFLGRKITDVLPAPVGRLLMDALRRVRATGEVQVVEYRLPLAAGEVDFEARIVQGGAHEILAIVRDVTERKRADEERRGFERRMLETQKLESLGILAGGIAHDFNNLLTSIMGNVSLARMKAPPDLPLGDYLKDAEIAAQRAADLAMQMLAYSGRGHFVIESVDVGALVGEMVNLLEVSIPKKVRLHHRVSPDLPPIEGDATQLRQVVMNLVLNAAEAIGDSEGDVVVTASAIPVTRALLHDAHLGANLPEGRYVSLEVTDTGRGMDAATLARIFDPFFTTKRTGRGLGLAAVMGIVRGHKGAIKVRSVPGKGTTFTAMFPESGREPRPPVTLGGVGERRVRQGTVLVVDDEEMVRSLAEAVLADAGYTVLLASDGREAVSLFARRAREISVVLLDMTMPGMGGDEAYEEMLRIRPDVRVVLSSGYTEEESLDRVAAQGLAGFLQKPYRASTLLNKIDEAMTPAVRCQDQVGRESPPA